MNQKIVLRKFGLQHRRGKQTLVCDELIEYIKKQIKCSKYVVR